MMEELLDGSRPEFRDGKFYSEGNEISREEAEALGWVPDLPGRQIHDYFELTYASWLTMPRTLLQSMPDEWQEKFVALLDEFDQEMGWAMDLLPATNVQVLARTPRIIEEEEECENCEGSGDDPEDPEEECPECIGGMITVEGDRYEEPEEVGTIPSPIAPYQRGRARVPLASMDPDDVARQHMDMKLQWLKANHIELWRKHFGPEFDVGEPVTVLRNVPPHVLPPIMMESECKGVFNGEIIEAIDHCLYKVRVALDHSEKPETADVQLHADQLESCKRG